jgi:hypothetical protein
MSVFSPQRIRRVLLAVGIGATVGMLVFLLMSDGLAAPRGGRIGGDFPAFYAAGTLAREGRIDSLYAFDAQHAAQRNLLPDSAGWIHFPYAPPVAIAYIPFTLLDFKTAYVLHTLLMAGCCVTGIRMLARHLPAVREHHLEAAVAVLTFYPMARAIVGGQNTGLSFLCAAGAAAALGSRRDSVAGLWLGAWLFKPQFALPVAAIVVLSGRPRVLRGLAVCGACWYAIGAWAAGIHWPLFWWEQGVLPFAAATLEFDRGNGISLRELSVERGIPWAGWLCSGLLGLFAIAAARRLGNPLMGIAVAVPAATLAAPHALFYDGGLAALPLVVAAGVMPAAMLPHLAVAWFAGAAQAFGAILPLPPLTLLLLYTIWLIVHVACNAPRVSKGMATSSCQPA